MRSLDPDIAGVERKGIAAFEAVPLEGLAPTPPSPASGGGLGRGCIAVVRIEYIDVLEAEPGTLVHSPGGAVGPVRCFPKIYGLRNGPGRSLADV